MSTSTMDRSSGSSLENTDGGDRKEQRRTRAQRWLEGSIAAWERDGRVSKREAAQLRQNLNEPTVLAVLPHFGVHLTIGAVLRFPIGSITRASYTLLNLLLATLRLLVRNIDRHQWRETVGIHSPLVILIAGMPGIGTFAYLASKPVRSNHLLLRVGLDAVLLKLPFHVYECTGLRWVVARPNTASRAQIDRTSPLKVKVWAPDIVLILGLIVGALAAADLLTLVVVELGLIDPTTIVWDSIVRMFDLNAESSLGTWFSAVGLTALSMLLIAIAFAKRQFGDRFAKHWLVLGVLMLGFSIDEVAKLHDPGGAGWQDIRDRIGLSGPLLYSWVIAGMVSVVVVAYCYRRFIGHLPQATRGLYILAAALYVGGEVVTEMFSGWYVDISGEQDFIYHALTTVEESLAIAGIFVAIAATLQYIQSNFGGFSIALGEPSVAIDQGASTLTVPRPAEAVVPQPVSAYATEQSSAAGPPLPSVIDSR